MGLRKTLSFRWQLFLLYVIPFWLVLIGMATWQVIRVSELKHLIVDDQLALIGERIADLYNNNRNERYSNAFMDFINRYYNESLKYDDISIQVRDKGGKTILNIGDIIPEDYVYPDDFEKKSTFVYKDKDTQSEMRFVHYTTKTKDNETVYVMLPYNKELKTLVSGKSTRFWLIFFGIAVFVTIYLYISILFFSQNIRILHKFAIKAARKDEFSPDEFDFPHDELGEISREIMTIYNQRVHEMEKREKEHLVALNAIKEKDRIKKELSANITHELSTPVTIVQGNLDILMKYPDMDQKVKDEIIEKAWRGAHRLSNLIVDITDITRLESGGKLVNVGEVNFHDIVFTFANMIDDTDFLKGEMEFSYDVPLTCNVFGNESLLTSILTNFTKNALKYSQGKVCRLELVKEDDDYFYFRYYDDGVGVPPEHLPHIFERFYRVKSGRGRNDGGTGLGLAIVDVAIKSFGGDIVANNHYPTGLEFNFTLVKYKPGMKPATKVE